MAKTKRRKRSKKRKSGIKIKPKNKGKLRKATKTKKGKKIPASTLRRLKKSKNPKTRQRANFALNARKWKKGGRRKR
jgi:oligoendopeptidase F